MKKCVNGKMIELTAEEIAAHHAQSIAEKSRPLGLAEVTALLIEAQINSLAVDDNTALRMLQFYPAWTAEETYSSGFKVRRSEKLWRCVQGHTAQEDWAPENAPALWEQINETYAGTLDDPISYEGSMALENGKYYIQNDVIYLCIRDTVNPVYDALADLVGLYVETALYL